MAKTAIILLADGFEEIEAVTPIDLLRRAGISVCAAGVRPIGNYVTGSHGIGIRIDAAIDAVRDDFDACILPGGLPGADNLAASRHVRDLILRLNRSGAIIAAICAAPAVVLAPLGLLDGKCAACYPGMQDAFPASARFVPDPVVADGTLITGRSAGIAADFSFKIIERLINLQTADHIRGKLMAG